MVLVFGATGYTGRMVVQDLVARGVPVRIAGRSQERLERLASKHDGLEWVVADVEDPESVARAAAGSDVLVTTVGPYTWWGHVAADAALEHGIPYIDVTGEPGWLSKVFNEYGPRAEQAGVAMLPAIGYDYVPGNLAGALALEAAGGVARSIDIGYFLTGRNPRTEQSFSKGTLQSLEASSDAMQFAFQHGEIVEERGARRKIEFQLEDRAATAVSIGSTEHYWLPALYPELRDVNAGLGWFEPGSTPADEPATSDEGGPNEDARAQARTNVIAVARDSEGAEISRVRLDGPNPYDLTGGIVGWTAQAAVAGELKGSGALGPVAAFGLERLRAACDEIGLREVAQQSQSD
ncbi:MAG: saccharopine dehydrogenase family protein [Solirubrobacterales bacterium]